MRGPTPPRRPVGSSPTRARSVPAPLALAVLGGALAFAGPARAQQAVATPAGIAAFNDDVQRIYDGLRPALERTLEAEVRAQLGAAPLVDGDYVVEVRRVHGLSLGIARAPGLRALSTRRLEVAVPAQGTWALALEADVFVKKAKGMWRPSLLLRRVRVEVDRLRALAAVDLDDADVHRPQVRRVERPQVEQRVRLRAGGLFTDLLMRVLSPFARRAATKALTQALDGVVPSLAQLQGIPGPVWADGAPLYTDSGAPLPWDEVVGGVEDKLRRDHLPHGTLLMAHMSAPSTATWLEAYRAGGAGNVGVAAPEGDGGDSAIWTGHYLAGEALRWAATRDPRALEAVRHAIGGLSALLEVHGDTGLLARVAAPEASPMGQRIATFPRVVRRVMRGEPWVGTSGARGISRDQYMGAFLGLALAHDLVADPDVRGRSRLLVERMLDYLVANRWYVDEDRAAFDPSNPGGSGFPTFWAPGVDQKLNALLIGRQVAPGKYDAEIARVGPGTETQWLAHWTTAFDIESYYKFNLAHGTAFNYFRLETDAGRWRDMLRAFLVLRRVTGHHRNPHFELIHASVDPSLRPTLGSAAREGLRRFLARPHRQVAPAVVDLSGITFVTVQVPVYALPGRTAAASTQTLPSEPTDPTLRPPGGDFLWQRNPFYVVRPNQGSAHVEPPGIDLTLPFWMGRHLGTW